METIINNIHIFLLALVRVSVLIFILPVFSYTVIPVRVKIGIAVILTILVMPMIMNQQVDLPPNLVSFLFMIGKEVLAGLIIGFSATLLFMAFQFAGSIVGMQMGFGIVNVIDPNSNSQISIIGQFLFILSMLIFIAIDGHLYLIQGIVQSYNLIPLTDIVFRGILVKKIVMMTGEVFLIAIKIGIPTIVALLLTNVALGIIARTVPQMNVFIVGFPLSIGLGLFTLATSLPLLIYLFRKLYLIFQSDVNTIIKALSP